MTEKLYKFLAKKFTTLCVSMYTQSENAVVRNSSAVNSFIDQGKEAMKMLGSHRTPRCSKHQFRDKIMIST